MIKQTTFTLDQFRTSKDIIQIESAFDDTFVLLTKGDATQNSLNRIVHVSKEGQTINSYP